MQKVSNGLVDSQGSWGFRNKIINGNFDIWQRGTTQSAVGYGSADRWILNFGGTGGSLAKYTGNLPSGSYSTVDMVAGASVTGSISLYQNIESLNCQGLAGNQVTISFYSYAFTGAQSLAVAILYPAVADTFGGTLVAIGNFDFGVPTIGSWIKRTATFTLPAGASNGLQLQIYRNGGGASDTAITQVQLEVGTVATPFEQRPIGTELALCQRYYEKSFRQSVAPINNSGDFSGSLSIRQVLGAASTISSSVIFQTAKRIPNSAITLFNPFSGTGGQYINTQISTVCTGTTANNIAESGFEASATSAAGSSANQQNSVHWTADAEL